MVREGCLTRRERRSRLSRIDSRHPPSAVFVPLGGVDAPHDAVGLGALLYRPAAPGRRFDDGKRAVRKSDKSFNDSDWNIKSRFLHHYVNNVDKVLFLVNTK